MTHLAWAYEHALMPRDHKLPSLCNSDMPVSDSRKHLGRLEHRLHHGCLGRHLPPNKRGKSHSRLALPAFDNHNTGSDTNSHHLLDVL